MTDKYKRLDAFLEKAFEASPNSPEACEAKIEITTNLRREYDDLLASGLSEDEALLRTCDSLGDISELFGKAREGEARESEKGSAPDSFDGKENDTGHSSEEQREGHQKKLPASPFRRPTVTFGVLLCALCWVPTVLFSVNGHGKSYIAAPVLIMVALGVMLFICSGSMRIGVSASTHLHYLLIGLGVASEIACAAPILFIGEGRLGLTLLFILISLGIVLIVTGATVPCDSLGDGDDGEDEKEDDTPPILKPIKHLITAMVLIAYFAVSFATGAWAVTWIIFLIGGALDDLVSSIVKLTVSKDEK